MSGMPVKLLAGSSGKSDGLRSLPFIFIAYSKTDKKSLQLDKI